jgi:hypothetical protein
MKTEARSNTLNFAIAGFVSAAMDLGTRISTENPASRSIYLPNFALIQALLTAVRSIE